MPGGIDFDELRSECQKAVQLAPSVLDQLMVLMSRLMEAELKKLALKRDEARESCRELARIADRSSADYMTATDAVMVDATKWRSAAVRDREMQRNQVKLLLERAGATED